jgi:hypothetical protein
MVRDNVPKVIWHPEYLQKPGESKFIKARSRANRFASLPASSRFSEIWITTYFHESESDTRIHLTAHLKTPKTIKNRTCQRAHIYETDLPGKPPYTIYSNIVREKKDTIERFSTWRLYDDVSGQTTGPSITNVERASAPAFEEHHRVEDRGQFKKSWVKKEQRVNNWRERMRTTPQCHDI